MMRKASGWKPTCNADYEWLDEVSNKSDCDIFICSYKTFTPLVKNVAYKVLIPDSNIFSCSGLACYRCESDDKYKDKHYSEMYVMKNIPSTVKRHKYIGFCHYRRYFSFLDEIPNLDEIFSEYDAISVTPIKFKRSVREQYGAMHNIDDLNALEEIVKNDFNDYYDAFKEVMDGNLFYPCNMFIMRTEDFDKYIKFLYDVVDGKFMRDVIGDDFDAYLERNKDKYIKRFHPNNTLEYQYRVGGYLMERLTNVFFKKHFSKIKTYDIILTENKYFKSKG